MDTIQRMRVFLRVAEAGSFTSAAKLLDMSVAALSRSVSDLETHLCTRLFSRSTRRLCLTSAGERYAKRCKQIVADVENAEEEARSAHQTPSGVLRVHSFTSIGQRYLLPTIAAYQSEYPDVAVDITLSQSIPDLLVGQHDISIITARALPDSELVAHRLGTTYSILCASPDYVHRYGKPSSPTDLVDHKCLVLKLPTIPLGEWELDATEHSVTVKVNGPMQANMADSLAIAVREGMGIAALPVHVAVEWLRRGELVQILPSYTLSRTHVYAVYPSRKYIDAKTKTWVNFLSDRLPDMIGRDHLLLGHPTPSNTIQN